MLLNFLSACSWFPVDVKCLFSSQFHPGLYLFSWRGISWPSYSTITTSFLCSCVFKLNINSIVWCVLLQLAFLVFLNIIYVKFIPDWYMYKISLMVGICLYECQFIHFFSSQWKFSLCQNWHHCQQYVVSILVHLHVFQCFSGVLLLDWGLYLVLFYCFLFYWFESYIACLYFCSSYP